MKHILFLLLPLLPALALAQTGTVKDSVRVLTTAEISAGNTPADTSHFYYIEGGSWKKVRMDSIARVARLKLAGDRGDIIVSVDGLTWNNDTLSIDSMQLGAGAVVLPGAKVTGTLPVSKGGTGSDTINFVRLTGTQTVAGAKTFSDVVTGARFNPTSSSSSGTGMFLESGNTLSFSTAGSRRFSINGDGQAGLGIFPNTETKAARTVFELRNIGCALTSGGNVTEIGIVANAVDKIDGWAKASTGASSFYLQLNGQHQFYVNASGNAGAAISWNQAMTLRETGRLGIGLTAPTARLHLPAGANAAESAPLKFTSGTALTTAEVGAMEFHDSRLHFTPSGTDRRTVNIGIAHTTASIDAPSISAGESWTSAAQAVTGAALGDVVSVGVQDGSAPDGVVWFAWVSSAGNIKLRAINNSTSSQDPAPNTFKIFITKF